MTQPGPLQPSAAAEQVAQAVVAFEKRRTGMVPVSVTVVFSADTVVVTLQGALSAAEQALAQTSAGAAHIQEFHRQLFADAVEPLRQEIERITGVKVREAAADLEATSGTVVHAFTTGTIVQVFLLAGELTPGVWRQRPPAAQ